MANLQSAISCSACETVNKGDARFCRHCGAQLALGGGASASPRPVFDRTRWEALAAYDKEVSPFADQIRPLGPKWMDELGAAYMVLGDRANLPDIVANIKEKAEAERKEREAREERQRREIERREEALRLEREARERARAEALERWKQAWAQLLAWGNAAQAQSLEWWRTTAQPQLLKWWGEARTRVLEWWKKTQPLLLEWWTETRPKLLARWKAKIWGTPRRRIAIVAAGLLFLGAVTAGTFYYERLQQAQQRDTMRQILNHRLGANAAAQALGQQGQP